MTAAQKQTDAFGGAESSTSVRKGKAQSESAPVALRAYWSQFVTKQAVSVATLLNLIGEGEMTIQRIPDPAYAVAFALVSDLRDRATIAEHKRGSIVRDRLHSQVNRELWRALKPFRRVGHYDISHLSADVPRETVPDTDQLNSGDLLAVEVPV